MRTIKQLPVAQEDDFIKFPDGQLVNKTETAKGTPVIREVYGDIITNIYAILRDSKVTPNEQEDSSETTYQLLEALKVFVNDLNDKQQVLTVAGRYINTILDFDKLPNNYVFIGRVSEQILASENYIITDSNNTPYAVNNSIDIPASSVVLIVLNDSGTSIIDLSKTQEESKSINTVFGDPLTYNESSSLLYYSNGNVLTDTPSIFNVENIIQINQSSVNIHVVDCILHKSKLICFTFNSDTLKYQAFAFDPSDLSVLQGEITIPDTSGVDNQPYFYCDGEFIYSTNSLNSVNESVNDYSVGKFSFNETILTITFVSFFDLNSSFEKTTNLFIGTNGLFYTLMNGLLYSYNVDGSARVLVGNFSSINGIVFKFNNKIYYSNGNVATKWNY